MSSLSTELKSSFQEPTRLVTKPSAKGELHNRLLAYALQFYHKLDKFPSIEKAAADLKVTVSEIEKLWNSEKFQSALAKQGIILREDDDGLLTFEQLIVANELVASTNKRTVRQTLEVLEITQAQYEGWLRDPVFQKYLKEKTKGILDASEYAAHRGLAQAVETGDLKAIQWFYELKGLWSPRLTVDFNVDVMISKVVDIIVKYVKDDETIKAIAKDIGELNAT